MTTLESSAVSEAGVTLVEARLASERRREVSLEATHDSPVWPPRREGVPAAGWSSEGWTGVVPADDTVALGYATPGTVSGRPLRIVDAGPPDDDEAVTARDVLRSLGDARPPRDALEPDEPVDTTAPSPTESGVDVAALDAIARRVDRAEALAAADSVEAAQAAVCEAGGMAAVRDLTAQLERDRERLDEVRRRVDELEERAAVRVPVENLARLE